MIRRIRQARFHAIWALLGVAALAPSTSLLAEWTISDKEEFLQTAEIIREKYLSTGVTNSRRATLSDGKREHDAHIQDVNKLHTVLKTGRGAELNFRDSYRYNIAAYRLDRILGLGMSPVCVERNVRGEICSVCWWVDDILMSEKERHLSGIEPPRPEEWNLQMHIVRVFDQLIYNVDRNLGNLLITENWKIWMIDHSRAFHFRSELRNTENLGRCDRRLLEKLRELDEATLSAELGTLLNDAQLEALLARRDKLVAFFDQEIAQKGEVRILYDFLETSSVTAQLE